MVSTRFMPASGPGLPPPAPPRKRQTRPKTTESAPTAAKSSKAATAGSKGKKGIGANKAGPDIDAGKVYSLKEMGDMSKAQLVKLLGAHGLKALGLTKPALAQQMEAHYRHREEVASLTSAKVAAEQRVAELLAENAALKAQVAVTTNASATAGVAADAPAPIADPAVTPTPAADTAAQEPVGETDVTEVNAEDGASKGKKRARAEEADEPEQEAESGAVEQAAQEEEEGEERGEEEADGEEGEEEKEEKEDDAEADTSAESIKVRKAPPPPLILISGSKRTAEKSPESRASTPKRRRTTPSRSPVSPMSASRSGARGPSEQRAGNAEEWEVAEALATFATPGGITIPLPPVSPAGPDTQGASFGTPISAAAAVAESDDPAANASSSSSASTDQAVPPADPRTPQNPGRHRQGAVPLRMGARLSDIPEAGETPTPVRIPRADGIYSPSGDYMDWSS